MTMTAEERAEWYAASRLRMEASREASRIWAAQHPAEALHRHIRDLDNCLSAEFDLLPDGAVTYTYVADDGDKTTHTLDMRGLPWETVRGIFAKELIFFPDAE